MLINIVYILIGLILLYVIYIAIQAINVGMEAKNSQKFMQKNKNDKKDFLEDNDLVEKLSRLNELHKSGSINNEEFEKAKKKILKD